MPTPGEKKALFFLSLVAVLGSAARLVAANRVPIPTAAEVAALDGQIRAVDSVRQGRRGGGGGRGKPRRSSRRVTADSADGAIAPLPPAILRPPMDLDRASAAELESLPGIGPALARRIVAARDSSGQFGSLDALQTRVRGVGPALARRLAPAVTFSGPYSPPSAERTEPFGNGGTTARAKRRRGH